jgi:hypothetical protein
MGYLLDRAHALLHSVSVPLTHSRCLNESSPFVLAGGEAVLQLGPHVQFGDGSFRRIAAQRGAHGLLHHHRLARNEAAQALAHLRTHVPHGRAYEC